jgi:riboflavin synthase
MFTGIISNTGVIKKIDLKKKNQFEIESDFINKIKIGESIACSGICLTVFKKNKNCFFVNTSEETLIKTNILDLKVGDAINLEKSIKVGDDISGHMVFGHIDGVSKVIKIDSKTDSNILTIKIKKNISKFLISKCSITLDGVSLTVNNVKDDLITINIIPYTWNNTSLKKVKVGDRLNTEIDMLARYVFKAIENLK